MLEKYKILLSHILVCTVICSAIYLPFASTPFIRHDDYYYPNMTIGDDCRNSEAYAGMVGYGRIIQAELTQCVLVPLSQKFTSAQFFIVLRLIILLAVGILSGLLSYWLRKVCAHSQTLSILISTLIVTLPGYTVYIGNTWFVTITVAMISVMIGALVLGDERVTGRWREDLTDWKRMSLALFFLLIALFNYQILALLFLIPPVAVLVLGDEKTIEQKRNIAFRYLFVFGAGLVAYLILQKFVISPLYLMLYPEGSFNFGYGEMSVELGPGIILSRFLHIFEKMMSFSFNFWFVQSNPLPAYLFFGIIAVGALLFFVIEGIKAYRTQELKSTAWRCVQTVGLLFCLFLGLQSPQLFYGDFYGYRITAHPSAMFVLLLVWSIRYIFKLVFRQSFQRAFLTIIFILTFCVSAKAQHQSLHDYAYLTMAEIDYLETQIQPLIDRKSSAAAIVRPRGNTKVSGDEHGMLTSCFDNDYGLHGMIKYIYRRNHRNPDTLRFSKSDNGRIITVIDTESVKQNIRHQVFVNMDVFLKTQVLPR